MCTNHSYHQCINEKEVDIIPGQNLQIEAVGQRYGIVPAVVTAELLDSDGHGSWPRVRGAKVWEKYVQHYIILCTLTVGEQFIKS